MSTRYQRRVERFLATLRHIPDATVLRVASRPIEPVSLSQCVVGWAAREAIAERLSTNAWQIDPYDWMAVEAFDTRGPVQVAKAAFGGTQEEWNSLFIEVCDLDHAVEEAFALRTAEAAANTRLEDIA